MYNRYLSTAAGPLPLPNEPPPEADAPPHASSVFSDLSRALSGKFKGVKLDSDTLLVLIVVWFLLKDEQELDWDLLLLIGGLLLLGI